jgi:hypothetical protein
MPVLKVYKNGNWEELGGTSPMNGGNADTLDGRHASEFALLSDIADLTKNDCGIYVQNDEPTEFEDGDIWIDLDDDTDDTTEDIPEIVIDATLTISGQAADAKAVGNALSNTMSYAKSYTDSKIDTLCQKILTGVW